MNKVLLALIALSLGVRASAITYVVPAGSNAAAIQAIVNTAGNTAGNTVMFSPGTYTLSATVNLPCFYGTIYTGPNVGLVTQTNLPTVVLTSTVPTNFAVGTISNGTTFTGNQGCTIEYLRFSGTQGGIIVYDPASGIVIQENAFDNNNPPAGGASSQPNIWIDGKNAGFTASTGVQHISVLWNTFFNNCAAIRASAYPDSGGRCAATWVNGYNNYLTWSNNTVNLTEEGLKLSEQSSFGISSLNADVENNNMQGNSRIMIESQMDTNGTATYSHNAFYQPFNPSYNTFELSVPEYTPSISPTHVISDDVFIGNVPVTYSGAGGHYGIGLELWGAGSIATYNLFQGGNGPPACPAGGWCSGWQICLGGTFTNGTVINNYFSGNDVWAGTANKMSNALTYEESASSSNAGLIQSPNTVVQNSTTIPVTAPAISAAAVSGGSSITLTDSDTNHRLTIFYTTDGSTPAIFGPGRTAGTSKVYTAPFTVPSGSTVKAIASWGQGANQGVVFPSFGYVPSSLTALGITPSTLTGKTMTSAYLHAAANTMVAGSTLQFTAYGVYSDGSVGKLANPQIAWGTSNKKGGRHQHGRSCYGDGCGNGQCGGYDWWYEGVLLDGDGQPQGAGFCGSGDRFSVSSHSPCRSAGSGAGHCCAGRDVSRDNGAPCVLCACGSRGSQCSRNSRSGSTCDQSTYAGTCYAGRLFAGRDGSAACGSRQGTTRYIPGTVLESGDAGGWIRLDLQLSPVPRRAGRDQPRCHVFL